MICPILKAGTMIMNYKTTFSVGPNTVNKRYEELQHESAECMRVKCEWFERGCPAHPVTMDEE